jgi:flavin-dependent dehydrogenase
MNTGYDVVVVGGGTAGIMAAIQAARAGASTLLVEKNGSLGGTLVVAGINYPASFHAYGTQIIAGIAWELCLRTWQETGVPVAAPATAEEWMRNSGIVHQEINPAVLAALAEEAYLQAGGELLLHTMLAGVVQRDGGWTLSLCTKTGLREVKAETLVDGTGDANVVTLAGFGVHRHPELQAPPWWCRWAAMRRRILITARSRRRSTPRWRAAG